MAIERKTLRSQVRDELLTRMRSGQARPGVSVNEAEMASELGVSRTPLREALICLESEGLLASENGKGFRFVKLSAAEFTELAPIIGTLEGLAIELTPPESLERIGRELRALAAGFNLDAADHGLITQRDTEWHSVLLSECPNARLLETIGGVRELFHRHESLLVVKEIALKCIYAGRVEFADRLIAGDLPGAQAALKANWIDAVRCILAGATCEDISL